MTMASGGKPQSDRAERRSSPSAAFVSEASLPPRRRTALPAFKHSAAASTVTLGRDS